MTAAKRDLRRAVSLVVCLAFVIGLCVAPVAQGRQRAGAPRAGESPLVMRRSRRRPGLTVGMCIFGRRVRKIFTTRR